MKHKKAAMIFNGTSADGETNLWKCPECGRTRSYSTSYGIMGGKYSTVCKGDPKEDTKLEQAIRLGRAVLADEAPDGVYADFLEENKLVVCAVCHGTPCQPKHRCGGEQQRAVSHGVVMCDCCPECVRLCQEESSASTESSTSTSNYKRLWRAWRKNRARRVNFP